MENKVEIPTSLRLPLLLLALSAIPALPISAELPPREVLAEAAEGATVGSIELLREALSIPNDAHFSEHVEANIEWAEKAFGERGFATERLATGGSALLLASRRAKELTRTVLIYLQLDGQPVDSSRWEQEDPYVPILKRPDGEGWIAIPWNSIDKGFDPDWRVFGRSASDAKGPAVMLLAALDVAAERGWAPTWNLKIVMDFEEELGSPHLPLAVERHQEALSADMLLIFDGPRHVTNLPTLSFGARGIADITITVWGPRTPQHSGHYGNYAPNPAQRLAELLASMKDDQGRVTIPGYYDGVEIDAAARAILEQTPDDEASIRRKIGIADTDTVAQTYQQALQYPSLNIRGLVSGWVGAQSRTIIPAKAVAEIDVRLVPETNAKRLIGLIRDHIVSRGYYLIEDREPTEEERSTHPRIASFTSKVFYDAFRTDYDSEVGLWLSRAMTRAFGAYPIRIRMAGGSIPISPFIVKLDVPAVAVPAANPDNNQHSPNENIRLGNYAEGILQYLAILTEPIEG